MNKLIIFAVLLTLGLGACANPDKSRDDARDTVIVNHDSPEVVQFNNHFPNVETKCAPGGFRLFVTTHDSAVGRNVIAVRDPGCPGFTSGAEPSVTGEG